MIKKLRIRFILLTVCSLSVVLILLIGSINVVNYLGIVEDADNILEVLAENGGMFPKKMELKEITVPKEMSPEVPYESRFFSVLLDVKGNVVTVDTGKIAAIDTPVAAEIAKSVWEKGKNTGFSGEYRFIRQNLTEGTRIIFLDCRRGLSTFRLFLVASCGISLFGLSAVVLLICFFSGRIIKPVSESYEKQKQFITDAGHEIKTPITIIDADSEVLEMDIGENEWLLDIRKQAERMRELTDNLICLSRMEEDSNRYQMVDFPVSDMVEEAAKSFQAVAKAQGKIFFYEVTSMLSMCADQASIRRLIDILLDNALKYSGENGEISLSFRRQGRFLHFSVWNTAEAVPEKNLERLFDRFYRADQSRNSQTGGHGIGLSIAKAIVTAHKGKIKASSQDGKSLQITVIFPA